MAKSENMRKINLEVEKGRVSLKSGSSDEDAYTSEIEKAQRMIEELRIKKEQQQQEELRQQQIQSKREEFSGFRIEVLDKLEQALPRIEQEMLGAKQEITELDEAKKHFLKNLKTIEAINPDRWNEDEVLEQSDKFESLLTKVARDYDQFVKILSEGSRGGSSIQNIAAKTLNPIGNFSHDFMRGFAFSLPLIITLSILAAILYNK